MMLDCFNTMCMCEYWGSPFGQDLERDDTYTKMKSMCIRIQNLSSGESNASDQGWQYPRDLPFHHVRTTDTDADM